MTVLPSREPLLVPDPSPGPARGVDPGGRGTTPNPVLAATLYDSMLTRPPKQRSTALLLCLFLGWLGAHRFYVGKQGSGRIYLFTGGVFFMGVVVDLVLILLGTFEDRAGNPLE